MSVRFILGRAGTGKTHHCVSAVLSELVRPSDDPLIFLAPEQATFQIEQTIARAAPSHGFWRLEVLGFSRLAKRIHAAFPGAEVISESTRQIAVRLALETRARELDCFGRSVATAGFAAQIERFVRRCLQERVTPSDLQQAARRMTEPGHAARLKALAACLSTYQEWLGPSRLDPQQRLDWTAALLDRSDWLRGARVWVDGFAGFTEQELATLSGLCRIAGEAEITLLLDPDELASADPLNLFARTNETLARIQALLRDAGVPVAAPLLLREVRRFPAHTRLARLEASLATGASAKTALSALSADTTVSLRVLTTLRDEIRAAAADIRRLVTESDGKVRYRDCALVVRDLQPVAALVREIFREHRIPFFLDQRRGLRSHALGRFLAAFSDAAERDAAPEPMSRLLRTGLVPFNRETCESLENHLLELDLGGLTLWSAGLRQTGRLAAAARRLGLWLTAPAEAFRSNRRFSAADWVRWYTAWLRPFRIETHLRRWIKEAQATVDRETAEFHRLAWETLQEALAGAAALGDNREISWADFRRALEGAFARSTVGLTPPALDQVLVSSIDRSRQPESIQYAWLVNFNDGAFPQAAPDEPLLGLDLQRALAAAGIATFAPARDDLDGERLLAYIAFSRASQSLAISYHTQEPDGSPAAPSSLIRDLRRALPDLKLEEHSEPQCRTLEEIARRALSVDAADPGDRYRIERLALHAARSSLLFAARAVELSRSLVKPAPSAPLGDRLRDPAWPRDVAWRCTPSDLEKFLQCPFKYFAEQRLRLHLRRGPQPDPVRLGNELHDALARVVDAAIQSRRPISEIPATLWQGWISSTIDHKPSDAHARFEQARIRALLQDLIAAHAARWQRGTLVPLTVEQRFGAARPGRETRNEDAQRWPALALDWSDGRLIEIGGSIDRVDVTSGAIPVALVVYDYKSTVQRGRLAAGSLLGDGLQLYIYLLAARNALQSSAPAAVFLAPLFPKIDRDASPDIDDEVDEETVEANSETRMEQFQPAGAISEIAAAALDQVLQPGERSPVANIKRNKSRGYNAKCDVKSVTAFRDRERQAEATIRHAVGLMINGDISVLPLLEGKRLPCSQCECGPLCRFERPGPVRFAEDLPQPGGATPRKGGT